MKETRPRRWWLLPQLCPHCGADLDSAASARVGRIPAWGVWVVVAGVLAAAVALAIDVWNC